MGQCSLTYTNTVSLDRARATQVALTDDTIGAYLTTLLVGRIN